MHRTLLCSALSDMSMRVLLVLIRISFALPIKEPPLALGSWVRLLD
jgi:hypothetical protein